MTAIRFSKRRILAVLLIPCVAFVFFNQYLSTPRAPDSSSLIKQPPHHPPAQESAFPPPISAQESVSPSPFPHDGRFRWADVPQRHPVASMIPIPSSMPS